MGGIIVIISAGLIAALLIWLMTSLEKEQYPFKLLLLFFVFYLFIIIGNESINEYNYCSWNVVNSTVSGNTVNYGMEFQCEENTSNNANTFYKTVLWLIRLIAILVFVYLLFYKYFVKLSMKIFGGDGGKER